jgi:hypothetical protein
MIHPAGSIGGRLDETARADVLDGSATKGHSSEPIDASPQDDEGRHFTVAAFVVSAPGPATETRRHRAQQQRHQHAHHLVHADLRPFILIDESLARPIWSPYDRAALWNQRQATGREQNVKGILFPVMAAATTAVAGWRVVHYVREPTFQRAALCAMLVAAAAAYTAATPWAYTLLGDLAGVVNLGTLVVYGAMLTFAAAGAAWLITIVYPASAVARRMWPLSLAYLLTGSVMAALFSVTTQDVRVSGPTAFDAHYATTPTVTVFLAVYLIAVGGGLAALGWLCWRWHRVTDRPWLRRGLPVIAAGAWSGLLYAAAKATYVALRLHGVDVGWLNSAAPGGAVIGGLLMGIGFTLPAVDRFGDYRARRRAVVELHPLWLALVSHSPELVLPDTEAPQTPRWAYMRLSETLYRMLVELRDSRMAMCGYFSPAVADQVRRACAAHGIRGQFVQVAVEAAQLRHALDVADGGPPPHGRADPPPGVVDLPTEVTWWRAVSREYIQPSITAAGDGPRPAVPAAPG